VRLRCRHSQSVVGRVFTTLKSRLENPTPRKPA
jgi:hypothetical protein